MYQNSIHSLISQVSIFAHPLCASGRAETYTNTWGGGHLGNSKYKGLRQGCAWHVQGVARPVLVKSREGGWGWERMRSKRWPRARSWRVLQGPVILNVMGNPWRVEKWGVEWSDLFIFIKESHWLLGGEWVIEVQGWEHGSS